ncbi:glycosyltransferase family 2 protein [Blastococcus sp. SYSU DS0973]
MSLRLSLVVTTVGRVHEVLRLARSVAATSIADRIELVLVDQSDDQRAVRALTELAPAVHWRATTSGRGISVGRNAGLRLATGDVVGFPNDNTWYPEATLPALLERFTARPDLGGLCVRLITADGRPAMLRWARRAAPVSRRSAHREVVSPGLFLRRRLVEQAGGFDERIGSGSAGRAQSGEESDLVFRVQDGGGRVEYDPALVVHNDEPRDQAAPAFIRKMAGYGVGQGVLWRRHRLPLSILGAMLARKLVAAPVRAVRGRRILARADLAWARGCVTGYLSQEPS